MLVVYDSLTGNVERFVSKLGMKSIKIEPGLIVKEPYILVTYTIGYGNIPKTTTEFLIRNESFIRGVASSGNKNWGTAFARSGILISIAYKVPLILTFELSGNQQDVRTFTERVRTIGNS